MTVRSFLWVFVGFVVAGCGGSIERESAQPVRFSIAWPERSRAVQGPASALSATVTVHDAKATGGDLKVTVNREVNPAAYTETYTSTENARTGFAGVDVRFYSQAGGAGVVVASGQAAVTIAADGSGIGDIAVANTIKSVTVDPIDPVAFSDTRQLSFTARDADSSLVAVSPGSAIWSVVAGVTALGLTADGVATGNGVGPAHVKVTVDGVTSAPVAVEVLPPADFQDPSFETLDVPQHGYLANGDISGIPWTGDSNWGVADAYGAWGYGGKDSPQFAFIQAANDTEAISHGALRQTVTGLIVGRRYRLSFHIARRNGDQGGNTGALVTALANGVNILDPTSPTTTGSWREIKSKAFDATQSTYEFTIQSILPQFPEDTTTLVDEVHLEFTP